MRNFRTISLATHAKRRGAGLYSIALLAAALHSSPASASENDAVHV